MATRFVDAVCTIHRVVATLPPQFKLPKMRSAADLPQAAQAILQAVAKGQLSPDEGAAVMALLETYRETLVTAEIAQRVEILEKNRC